MQTLFLITSEKQMRNNYATCIDRINLFVIPSNTKLTRYYIIIRLHHGQIKLVNGVGILESPLIPLIMLESKIFRFLLIFS